VSGIPSDANANPAAGQPGLTDHVRIEDANGIRTITLNRPDKKNAITGAMYAALADALTSADADHGAAVVLLTAAGDTFSAGNDIADFLHDNRSAAGGPRPGSRFLRAIAFFSKPIVAAVPGLAIGVGATMLLHCDVVIASDRAVLQFPFARLGLVPEAASTVLLPARVGLQRASNWLLLGERIAADEALRSGLVTAVVAHDTLASAAHSRAEALAKLPPGAVRDTKRLIRAPIRAAVEQALRDELSAFEARLRSPEAGAAFEAFLSKTRRT
jgi:enoyl-CoA hydratase/carnithine racemase